MAPNQSTRPPYEAPTITVLGSIHALTLDYVFKQFGSADGFTYMGTSIGNASP